MVKGSIKLVIQSDARQAEKDLQALEKSAQRIKDLEKENAALGKSYDQMRAKAEKAAQATLEAASKAAAAGDKMHNFQENERYKHDFGFDDAKVDQLTNDALSSNAEYQKLVKAAEEAADKHQQLAAAQKEAEKSAADLKRQIAENTQQLADERTALAEHQEKTQKSAASTQKLNEKLKQTSKSGKKASAGLLGVGKSAKSASRGALNLGLALKSMMLYMGVSKAIEAMKAGFADLAQASTSFNGSMSGLSSSFLQVRNSIAAACAPALQALTPIIQTVANAFVTAMNAVGAFSARLFGNATTFTQAKYAAVDYAKSVADTAKTAKDADKEMGSLASFDQVNNISEQKQTGASADNGKPAPQDMFETVGISEETVGLADRVRESFERMLEPLRRVDFSSVTSSFDGLKEAFSRFFSGLLAIDLKPLGESLARVAEAASPIVAGLFDGLSWFLDNIAGPLAKWAMECLFPAVLDVIAGAIKLIGSVLEAVKPLFLWLWDNFLEPVAKWTGGVIVSVLGWIAEKLTAIGDWISSHQEVVQGMTVTIASFFAAWKVAQLLSFIQQSGGVVAALKKVTAAVTAGAVAKAKDRLETVKLTLVNAKDFVVSMAKSTAALAKQAAQWTIETAKKVASTAATWAHQAATAAATAATWLFNAAITVLTSPITLVVVAIGALIAIVVLLVKNWDKVKEAASTCWNKIKEVWNKAGDWFHEHVTEPITGFFTTMWAGAKKTFHMAIDWIKKKFTDAVNGGIALVESFINFIIRGINVLVRGINKLSFDVPDWVPEIGGKSLGFNIPLVPQVKIPRLATGAVIPPNREFAAILGDQRHGTNIEAPEGLIRQIVREELGNVYSPVLNAINNSNLGKKAVIMGDVYMDSQKVGRVVARPVFKEGNRAGYIKVKV